MRYAAFSTLHAAAGRFVTCALAHFTLPACGRATARYGVRLVLRGDALQMSGLGAGGDVLAVSPVPPSRESRPGAFGGPLEGGGAHRFFQWGDTGSANNPWKSGGAFAKSLILEAIPPTSRRCVSTGYAVFSTGCVSAGRRAAPSFSLSKSLKEKKKEQGGRQAERSQGHPRVEGVFPRVRTPAYFLIHGFHGSQSANPWKSVEEKSREINGLVLRECESTGPQVALPVVPPQALEIGYNGGAR